MKDSIAQIHDLELDVTKYFPTLNGTEIVLKGHGVMIGVIELTPAILLIYLYKTESADSFITEDIGTFIATSKYEEIVYSHSMPDKMDDLIYKLDIVGHKLPETIFRF